MEHRSFSNSRHLQHFGTHCVFPKYFEYHVKNFAFFSFFQPSLLLSSSPNKRWSQLSSLPLPGVNMPSHFIFMAQGVHSAFALLLDFHRTLLTHALALSAMREGKQTVLVRGLESAGIRTLALRRYENSSEYSRLATRPLGRYHSRPVFGTVGDAFRIPGEFARVVTLGLCKCQKL